MTSRCGLGALVVAAVAVIGVGRAHPVAADVGVAVDLAAIDVDEPLAAGDTYRLPQIEVRNPGGEAAPYRVVLRPIADAGDIADTAGAADSERVRAPAPQWLIADVDAFTLEPGQRQPVGLRLRIPSGAAPGRYEALIAAELAPAGSAEGASVGAAAATRLSFSVTAPAADPEAASPEVRWFVAGGALLAAGSLAVGIRRRWSLRIGLVRRT